MRCINEGEPKVTDTTKEKRIIIRLTSDAAGAMKEAINISMQTCTGANAFYLVQASMALNEAVARFEKAKAR